MSFAKVIGVYAVPEAEEPCYPVELGIDASTGIFPVGHITQEVAGAPRENWQAPYAERIVAGNAEINALTRVQVARVFDDARNAPPGSSARKVADFRAASATIGL